MKRALKVLGLLVLLLATFVAGCTVGVVITPSIPAEAEARCAAEGGCGFISRKQLQEFKEHTEREALRSRS